MLIFNEWYGEVTRAQLRAYREYNVSPADHDDLVRVFGADRTAIVRAVKAYSSDSGFSPYLFMKDHR